MTGKKLLAGSALILVCYLGWSLMRGNSDEKIAESLMSSKQAISANQRAKSEVPVAAVKRLTNQVVADGHKIAGAWAVQLRERSRPRLKLPAEPLPNGTLKITEVAAEQTKPREELGYVGAQACASCHQQRHAGFVKTAHHLTSAPCTPTGLLGSVEAPANQLATDNEDLFFTIQTSSNDGVAQTVHLGDWSFSIPMDVIVGSGKLAQTFLFWNGDALFESHVSYFSGPEKWLASPGFGTVDANYARPIRSECLECHVTFISEKKRPNFYHRESAIWGISCERCHGPGKQHVEYHTANPDTNVAKFVAQPKEMPRERQLDLCGQCHSGEFKFLKKPFRFRPGERIDSYHRVLNPNSHDPGVHTSNQLTRLRRSECFKQTEMTCTTCHDPHVLQRGNTLAFSQSCLQCHEAESCGKHADIGDRIARDCISCHMPSTKNIDMEEMVSKGLEITSVDHFIRIVRE